MCFEGRLYNRSSVNDPPFCAPNLMAIYNGDLKPFLRLLTKGDRFSGPSRTKLQKPHPSYLLPPHSRYEKGNMI
jgi:hypothetical protein